MGLSKVVDKGDGKVVLVHQLDGNGTAYAEDITVEVQAGVSPSRLDWLSKQDGKIGVANVSFSAYEGDYSSLRFPDA